MSKFLHNKIKCSLCDREAKDSNWANSSIVTDITNVEHRVESSGVVDITMFHICNRCFKNILAPFLRSLGAKEIEEHYQYQPARNVDMLSGVIRAAQAIKKGINHG